MPIGNDDAWRRAQDVFAETAALPARERMARLDVLCAGDTLLRREVELLLRSHDGAEDGFLRVPPPPPDPSPPAGGGTDAEALSPAATEDDRDDPLLGRVLDGFRIDRVLSAGGMGIVYHGTQLSPERPVALKVLRLSGLLSGNARRFEYEAQVLARLTHPHIAQIYHAGRCEGMPFFAMEYVPEAQPITDFARNRQLSANAALELFLQVCDAVQFGHQRGILHRDLKPANILVDADGRARVIDFGIAKATDHDLTRVTCQTETGHLLGTVQYMSPEQCAADALDLDVRSDVYALGAVLYELLCGRPPYDVSGKTLASAARIICEQDPAPPELASQVTRAGRGRRLHRDLRHILLTTLEKDRARRFASVADLQRDIRHYLSGEPIEARRPSRWARMARWIGRHPAMATVAACALIASASLATTALAIQRVAMQPYAVRVDRALLEVSLISRLGHVRHTWSDAVSGAFVNDAIGVPGEQRVLVGFALESNSPFRGSLVAFDPSGKLDVAIRSLALTNDDLPPDYVERRGFCGELSTPNILLVDDIFAERPGNEIVVAFTHGVSSLRTLIVCDADLDVLYQFNHDGPLSTAGWMRGPGLLVLGGTRDALSLADRAYPTACEPDPPAFPVVVFAVRPELGFRDELGLPEAERSGLAASPGHPVWLRTLIPGCWSNQPVRFNFVGRARHGAPDASVELSVYFGEEPRHFWSLEIDEDGDEIPFTRFAGDAYTRARYEGRAPPLSLWELGPLPEPRDPRFRDNPPRLTPPEMWGSGRD